MNMELPDDWGSEPVSEILHSAYLNNISFFIKFCDTPLVKSIREINSLFKIFTKIEFKIEDVILPNMLTRSHSAYLGAIRLATSGQAVESYMVSRGCLENALYALYMYDDTEYVYIDSNGKIIENNNDNGSQKVRKRIIVWLDRGKSPEATNEVRRMFSNRNVMRTLEMKESNLYKVVSRLYTRTIDYGAHPNLGGIASTCTFESDGGEDQFLIAPDSPAFMVGVQTVVEIGMCSLFIFHLVFESYFDTDEYASRLNELAKLFPKNLKGFSL